MPRLLRERPDGQTEVFELRLGVNRFGRSTQNHFTISDPTVSAHHCDITLTAEELLLRECGSAKGTFVNDKRVKKAALRSGQGLRLGDVELLVESTEVTVCIPTIERPAPAPPPMEPVREAHCPRHPDFKFTFRCTNCHEPLCEGCVSRVRREKGKMLIICSLCGRPAEPLVSDDPEQSVANVCLHHPGLKAAFRCPNCHGLLCSDCVTRLPQRNGTTLKFCTECNHPVELIATPAPSKTNLLSKLASSVKRNLTDKPDSE